MMSAYGSTRDELAGLWEYNDDDDDDDDDGSGSAPPDTISLLSPVPAPAPAAAAAAVVGVGQTNLELKAWGHDCAAIELDWRGRPVRNPLSEGGRGKPFRAMACVAMAFCVAVVGYLAVELKGGPPLIPSDAASTCTTTYTAVPPDLSVPISTPLASELNGRPHIVMIVADDMGFNDIGYSSTDICECTPNIDALAASGVKLGRYYSQATCTPARAALMTGRYPATIGVQHLEIASAAPWGLPTSEVLLPQLLGDGYTSHAIGKWHLGHYSDDVLPLARGFDSFYGFLTGFEDYFTHVSESQRCSSPNCFYDLRDGNDKVTWEDGQYNTYLFSDRAKEIIAAHNVESDGSLFLYFSPPNVHRPLQAPPDVLEEHADTLAAIKRASSEARKTFAGMTLALDAVVGELIAALKDGGLYDDALVVFVSDNGGMPSGMDGGNNFPLRGGKMFLFEGGVRVQGFVHSPKLVPPSALGGTYHGYMHATDWVPTLVGGIIGDPDGALLPPLALDGVDQWGHIIGVDAASEATGEVGPRTEILLNVDPFPLDEMETTVAVDDDAQFGAMIDCTTGYKIITNTLMEPAWPPDDLGYTGLSALGTSEYSLLYNLNDDPEETTDLREREPAIYSDLLERLLGAGGYSDRAAQCQFQAEDALAYDVAREHGGFITPWVSRR